MDRCRRPYQPRAIRVIADDRETNCETIQALKETETVSLTVQHLPLGDYEVDGRLLFERKTLIDLAASIKDGRLFRQASRLASSPVKGVVIIEGSANDLVRSGMRREAIQGALITLSLFMGIPLLRSRDARESARLMLYAANQAQAIIDGALPRKGKRPQGKRRAQLHLLQGLPDVGPERARCLLESFGSVEAVFTASANELLKVSGIGVSTAEAIRWAVSENRQHYALGECDPIL